LALIFYESTVRDIFRFDYTSQKLVTIACASCQGKVLKLYATTAYYANSRTRRGTDRWKNLRRLGDIPIAEIYQDSACIRRFYSQSRSKAWIDTHTLKPLVAFFVPVTHHALRCLRDIKQLLIPIITARSEKHKAVDEKKTEDLFQFVMEGAEFEPTPNAIP
jgi:hypothetical protein